MVRHKKFMNMNRRFSIELQRIDKRRGRVRPQIGPLTFLKIFFLEMIYSGRSQHSEPSYAILYYWP